MILVVAGALGKWFIMSRTEKTGFSRVTGHMFLVFILCLLAFTVGHLVYEIRTEYSGEKYANVVVVLMLLFNHIAFQYTTTGWPSKVMKTLVFCWLAFGMIYIMHIVRRTFA